MLARTSVRNLGAIALIALLALAAGFLSQSTANADPCTGDNCADTHLDVGSGAGVAPVIECKWELPDMRPASGFQYEDADHNNDDDMTKAPGSGPVPCDLQRDTSGNVIGTPTMDDGEDNMIQVKPNLEDTPIRLIQLWAAVDNPQNVSASGLFWHVYEPKVRAGVCPDPSKTPDINGWCEKVKVHYDQRIPSNLSAPNCSALGAIGSDANGTMFEAAGATTGTGQLTDAAVNDTSYGMKIKCQQGTKALYRGQFELSKDQPCGEYKVVLTVENTVSGPLTLTNYIDILCTFALRVDFDRVNWASIGPDSTVQRDGDFIFNAMTGGPDNDNNPPTVTNVGNDDMSLQVTFGQMTQDGAQPTIDDFDTCFRNEHGIGSVVPLKCFGKTSPFLHYGVAAEFGDGPNEVLCANELGKLDLSVHTKVGQAYGTYHGTVTVVGHAPAGASPDECMGQHHVTP